MEFIKKNYEKIILSLVLLGLVAVLLGMWFVIAADKQQMEDLRTTYFPANPKPLPALDMSRQEEALARLKSPPVLDFSETNKLFNPVQWQRAKNGELFKIANPHMVGPYAAAVTKITPLYFSISLDSVITNAGAARYVVVVENQAAAIPALRHPQRHYISLHDKLNNLFTLEAVKGPADNPTQLIFRLADTGETAVVSNDKPFQRVDAYTADLKYDPEKLIFTGQRVGDHISFAGDDYNIIAIGQNEVILSAQSNQKNYTLHTP